MRQHLDGEGGGKYKIRNSWTLYYLHGVQKAAHIPSGLCACWHRVVVRLCLDERHSRPGFSQSVLLPGIVIQLRQDADARVQLEFHYTPPHAHLRFARQGRGFERFPRRQIPGGKTVAVEIP